MIHARLAPGEIVGPYESVRTKTRQLRNLHATIDALRQLVHRIKLVQKLRAQLSPAAAAAVGGLDLAKAAKLISDIRALDAEGGGSGGGGVLPAGIDAADADDAFLQQSVTMVRQQAEVSTLGGQYKAEANTCGGRQ